MKVPEISVIVTVHNAERYIEECVLSVSKQTFSDIEILCIDGGSIDSTPSILNKLQNDDKRIVVVNDKNTSYGHKINVGIDTAKGKYVAILESDDCYLEDMLEKLYILAEQTQVDFVDGDLYRMFDYHNKELGKHDDKYIDKNAYYRIIENNWNEGEIFCPGAIYTALYRKSFLLENRIRMHESPGASYQDVGFAFLTHILAKNSYHINEPVYKYRQDNEGSSIYNCKKIYEIADEFAFIKQEFEKRFIANENIWNCFYKTKYGCYQERMNFMIPEGRILFVDRLCDELNEDVKMGRVDIKELIAMYGNSVYGNYPDREKILDSYANKAREILPERVIKLLNETAGKHLVICGFGKRGKEALHYLTQNAECDVDALCDNSENVRNQNKDKFEIITTEQAVEKYREDLFIVANKKFYEEVKKQLINLKIPEEQIIYYF